MPDLADIVANYFERGYRFRRIEAENAIHTQSPKAVFLIHGWGVRAVSMDDLAYALADIDSTVFNYDYPSAERNIEEQPDLFTDYEALEKQKAAEQAELDKEKRLQQAVLNIKKRMGANAILKGMNLEEGATGKARNEQIGGHRK